MNQLLSGKERREKHKYIDDNIDDIPDKEIGEIYNKFTDVLKLEKTKKVIDRVEQMKYIDDNFRFIDDNKLLIIEKIIANCFIESDDKKMRRVALEITNKILDSLNKPHIKDLCEFVNIRRDDILSEPCKAAIIDNKTYISDNGFSDLECFLYKTKLKHLHLSILRCMLKKIGYDLESKARSKRVNKERIMYTDYSVQLANAI